ncbi:MAG: hypothetical protein KJ607_01330 [Bacteroidetes bacterium]|nr:hypothetical protein [Bacteroidota bacterium]
MCPACVTSSVRIYNIGGGCPVKIAGHDVLRTEQDKMFAQDMVGEFCRGQNGSLYPPGIINTVCQFFVDFGNMVTLLPDFILLPYNFGSTFPDLFFKCRLFRLSSDYL